MNSLSENFIAIDTNVFEHLLNPQENCGDHIDILLKALAERKFNLIVDEKGRIEGEYKNRISPIIKESMDTNLQKRRLLELWFLKLVNCKKRIKVKRDKLEGEIKKIITEQPEKVDRIFVYVACASDCTLITNDIKHIIKGQAGEKTERRKRLLRKTRKHRPGNKTKILTSKEAYDCGN